MFKYVGIRVQIQCPPYRAYRCFRVLQRQSAGLVGGPWKRVKAPGVELQDSIVTDTPSLQLLPNVLRNLSADS